MWRGDDGLERADDDGEVGDLLARRIREWKIPTRPGLFAASPLPSSPLPSACL